MRNNFGFCISILFGFSKDSVNDIRTRAGIEVNETTSREWGEEGRARGDVETWYSLRCYYEYGMQVVALKCGEGNPRIASEG